MSPRSLSAPRYEAVAQHDSYHKPGLTYLQKEKTDLKDALIKRKVVLTSSRKTLGEKIIARRATVSALGTLERQF